MNANVLQAESQADLKLNEEPNEVNEMKSRRCLELAACSVHGTKNQPGDDGGQQKRQQEGSDTENTVAGIHVSWYSVRTKSIVEAFYCSKVRSLSMSSARFLGF